MASRLALKKYYKEVFFIEPNDLGNKYLDSLFHKFVPYLKRFPFLILLPLSFGLSLFSLILFKRLVVSLVSLFQYGF